MALERVRMPAQGSLGVEAPRLRGGGDLKEHPAEPLVVEAGRELAHPAPSTPETAARPFLPICFQTASAYMSAGSRGGSSLKTERRAAGRPSRRP
jgi:hypothetical protein